MTGGQVFLPWFITFTAWFKMLMKGMFLKGNDLKTASYYKSMQRSMQIRDRNEMDNL